MRFFPLFKATLGHAGGTFLGGLVAIVLGVCGLVAYTPSPPKSLLATPPYAIVFWLAIGIGTAAIAWAFAMGAKALKQANADQRNSNQEQRRT